MQKRNKGSVESNPTTAPKKQVVLFKSSFCIITSTLSAILALGRIEVVAYCQFEVAGV